MTEWKKVYKKLIWILFFVPLAVGATGYILSGDMVTNSLYASFALYYTNPVSGAYNGWIEFARWTAPLATATAILCILGKIWNNAIWWFKCLAKDSVAVYSDEEIKIKFAEKTKAIYPGEKFKSFAKSHIILFSSDQKNLKFYEAHKDKIKNKPVYIGLRELEYGLIKETGNAVLFDINGSIARNLWKQIGLWNRGISEANIVIYGDSFLAQNVLSHGLLLNLFSDKQHVVYHVIAQNDHFQIKHPDMSLMNWDTIDFYHFNDKKVWELLGKADVVIVADCVPTELLQMIAAKALDSELYYYSLESGDIGDFLAIGNIRPFGRNEDILTDENIRMQKLVQSAIALNAYYAEENDGEKDWNKLSGFVKWSNISSADYMEILAGLDSAMPDEEFAELEHIRWCRFHYLNYWKYGVPDNGKNKDEQKRIHKDLMDFKELPPEEQEKDFKVVNLARKNRRK